MVASTELTIVNDRNYIEINEVLVNLNLRLNEFDNHKKNVSSFDAPFAFHLLRRDLMSTSGPHRSVCAPDTSKAKHLLGSSELIGEFRKINPL